MDDREIKALCEIGKVPKPQTIRLLSEVSALRQVTQMLQGQFDALVSSHPSMRDTEGAVHAPKRLVESKSVNVTL